MPHEAELERIRSRLDYCLAVASLAPGRPRRQAIAASDEEARLQARKLLLTAENLVRADVPGEAVVAPAEGENDDESSRDDVVIRTRSLLLIQLRAASGLITAFVFKRSASQRRSLAAAREATRVLDPSAA